MTKRWSRNTLFWSLCFFMVLVSCVIVATGRFGLHGFKESFDLFSFPESAYATTLASIVMLCVLAYLASKFTRIPDYYIRPIVVVTKVLIICYLSMLLSPNLLTTPYKLGDQVLFHMDLLMHVNVFSMMTAITHHPIWIHILNACYRYWLLVTLILMSYLGATEREECAMSILLMAQMGMIITSMTFYYFPTLGPIASNPTFWLAQKPHCHLIHNCISLQNVTEYLHMQNPAGTKPLSLFNAGFVSFPSYHFYAALLIVYLCVKHIRWLIIPSIIYAALIGLSTLFLGNHFLVDLIGSVLMFMIVLLIKNKLIARFVV